MTNIELNNLQNEAYEHLWNGRHRMALTAAEKLYQAKPNDSESAICLAWAYLENGQPTKAMEYANLAVELKGDNARTRFFRAYILTRMSIFEGAIADIEKTIEKEKNLLSWTYLNQARAYAGLRRFEEAEKAYSYGLMIAGYDNKDFEVSGRWFQKAGVFLSESYKITRANVDALIRDAYESLKAKEPWFALFAAQKILDDPKVCKEKPEAELIELEAMYNMFQYRPALKKAEAMKKRFHKDEKFSMIYKALVKFVQLEEENSEEDKASAAEKNELNDKLVNSGLQTQPTKTVKFRTDAIYFLNEYAELFAINIYDARKEAVSGTRIYYVQINEQFTHIGAEIIFHNLFFEEEDKNYFCRAVWYLNDFEIGRNNFNMEIPKKWESVIFSETMGSNQPGFWSNGQGKVEIYINDTKIGEKYFGVSDNAIEDIEDPYTTLPGKKEAHTEKQENIKPKVVEDTRTIEELLAELDSYIGLKNIKQAIRDFISYLEFIKERKRHGLKTNDKISINAVFLGNPGTGKTIIARLLGNILKSMGILSRGHVIEVDRASLVGQYIGETAQKTEKIINEAVGGVLFIDEAYTLAKKGGTTQDFGQEAIDLLLKRMEDKKGEFVVITAGYPEEMNIFLESNPGLKSRFTHTFNFEDYTPDELIHILEFYLKKEEYIIDPEAQELLKKEFIKLYRNRDKTFGNARIVRNIFDEAKIHLGKRVVSMPPEMRTKDVLNTITVKDIARLVEKGKPKKYNLTLNEEALAEALKELENLVGLNTVKNEINDMVKLARLFASQGEDLTSKFDSHFLFLGNPGTGKTTVARLFSKIFSALGILSKGHLIETDRQGLVAGYVGQTAEKTSTIIDKSIGGTLFIDEAYALSKKNGSDNDFGNEAIDILLKRMEDDRGKFITIAAGYTDEMKYFVASNPGLQSRFQKTFFFEDYTPDELMEIVSRSLAKDKKRLTNDARDLLLKHFNEIYRNRDKKFGNARIVRNILESAKQKLLLRVADMPSEKRSEEKLNTISIEDIQQALNVGTEARDYEVKGDPLKLQAYIDELNSLVGLDGVKQGIYKLISGSKIAQLRKERGLQVIDKTLDAVFMGNQGTGKTTVASLFSKILKELGVLDKGHLVEVDRSDLVADYRGQTTVKTERIIEEALGGTLLINEIYNFAQGANDYGWEAIDALLKRMEDYKGKFVAIVTGHPEEMQIFIETNPILRTRFPNVFNFEDYDPRQLLGIAYDIAEKNGYLLDEGALQIMLELFTEICDEKTSSFDNAQTAKNVLYTAISNQEERIANMINPSDDDLITITLEDLLAIKPV